MFYTNTRSPVNLSRPRSHVRESDFTSTTIEPPFFVAQKLLDQRTARRLLEQNDWEMTRGGTHVVKMEKQGQRPITLPRHRGKTYSRGLTAAILKQAGLD